MGGGFATAGLVPADFFPGHGGVAGLVKTLAREWPRSVRVRVVDLDPHLDVELLAANLVQEVQARDGSRGGRLRPSPTDSPPHR